MDLPRWLFMYLKSGVVLGEKAVLSEAKPASKDQMKFYM